MSMREIMQGWERTVHNLLREARQTAPESETARPCAMLLRAMSVITFDPPRMSEDLQHEALFEAQRLAPIDGKLEGPVKVEVTRWEELRARGPFDGPSLGGAVHDYYRWRAGEVRLQDLPRHTQELIEEQARLTAVSRERGHFVTAGWATTTLDVSESLETYDEEDA